MNRVRHPGAGGDCRRGGPACEAGYGLLEMMIALLLGALITLAASAVLVGTNASYVRHADSARVNDGGRFALALIAAAVRQSAYVDWDAAAPAAALDDAPASIIGLDNATITRGSNGIDNPLASDANGSDVLAVRFTGSGAGDGDGAVLNCAGFGVPAGPARGWSIFYVAEGADGSHELRCKYRGASGWGADAVVRGVDSFQVLYGVDTDAVADGIPNAYLTATAINTMDAALVAADDDEAARNRDSWWRRVASVQAALLLHGEAYARGGDEALSYDLFGAAYTGAARGGDVGAHIAESSMPQAMRQRVRRVFSTTIALRNAGAAR